MAIGLSWAYKHGQIREALRRSPVCQQLSTEVGEVQPEGGARVGWGGLGIAISTAAISCIEKRSADDCAS